MNSDSLLQQKMAQHSAWLEMRKDLRRLNELREGLGEEAFAYILTGEDGTVLSTLSTLCNRNILEVCNRWVEHNSPSTLRRRLLIHAEPYDPDLAYRCTEVLCAASASTQLKMAGSSAVPGAMRVFFTEALRGMSTTRAAQSKGLVPELALAMTQRFGGTLSDLMDVLYVQAEDDYDDTHNRSYRDSHRDLRELFRDHAPMVTEAVRRMPAGPRAACIADLGRWGFSQEPTFTPLLVTQAGDASKQVREAAVAALATADTVAVEARAAELLGTGNVSERAGMVDLFARLTLPNTRSILTAHREREKTARILASIDSVLTFLQRSAGDAPDDVTGYTALDGTRVPIPPPRPLADGPIPEIGEAGLAELKSLFAQANEQTTRHNEARKAQGSNYVAPLLEDYDARAVLRHLKGETVQFRRPVLHFLSQGAGADWLNRLLEKMPDSHALRLVRGFNRNRPPTPDVYGPGARRMNAYLSRTDADLRSIEDLDIAAGATVSIGSWREQRTRPLCKGDLLRWHSTTSQSGGSCTCLERSSGLIWQKTWPSSMKPSAWPPAAA